MKLTRHQKAGVRYAKENLLSKGKPVTLFAFSAACDSGAREAGRVSDLFQYLDAYARLLPDGWTLKWLKNSDSSFSDSVLYAVPADWKDGDSESESLLTGEGKLAEASHVE